jgi:uncharacterized membrane protein
MFLGILSAGSAFTLWGIFPLYLKLLKSVPSLEILSHRVMWSAIFLGLILASRRQWDWVQSIRARPQIALAFVASAAMLGANWVIYIWAVNADRIVDASLGYFIAPLFNVLFGILLGERLKPIQWIAIALAGSGVAWLTLSTGELPWIGLVLAVTFSLYGLIRKTAALGALERQMRAKEAELAQAQLSAPSPDANGIDDATEDAQLRAELAAAQAARLAAEDAAAAAQARASELGPQVAALQEELAAMGAETLRLREALASERAASEAASAALAAS